MTPWETPVLEEIDMNAEIGGYQPDAPGERDDDLPFAAPQPEPHAALTGG